MKTNVTKLALFSILILSSATSALAEDNSFSDQWIQDAMRSSSQPAPNDQAPYGHKASVPAERTVTIDTGTKYLNVNQQETVEIHMGNKIVDWTFDTLGTQPFPLSKIIPGAAAKNITVYVADNPLYAS